MDDDFIKATNAHDRRMFEEKRRADERRREQMNTRIGYFLSTVVALAIIVSVIGGISWNVERNGQRAQVLRQACMDRGGNWVTLGTNGDPVCVKISGVDQ